VLGIALVKLDKAGKSALFVKWGWGHFFSGGADSALTLLSTVANSMITVAVTAFSVTLVALTLASQQFGPRVLRNFMMDRSFHFVLGTFSATFIYCLIVLRLSVALKITFCASRFQSRSPFSDNHQHRCTDLFYPSCVNLNSCVEHYWENRHRTERFH
jgi:hypothetical protein